VPHKSSPNPRSAKAVQTEPWWNGFVKQVSFCSGVKGGGVMNGERGYGDCHCDEMMYAGWSRMKWIIRWVNQDGV